VIWLLLGQFILQIPITYVANKKKSILSSLTISLPASLLVYFLKFEKEFQTSFYITFAVSVLALLFICISGTYLHFKKTLVLIEDIKIIISYILFPRKTEVWQCLLWGIHCL